jgi:hypothetical protein
MNWINWAEGRSFRKMTKAPPSFTKGGEYSDYLRDRCIARFEVLRTLV